MSQELVNPLQNISYTNRDFQSIYGELLDTVKKLTYKWDPSISNESDPGLILLKLNALIADKCNYNLDTNILECFPLSVTQQPNARQLFEQLGYVMRWYRSAVTDVSIKWIGDITLSEEVLTYTIPAFTTVCDANKNVVYTLIGAGDLSEKDRLVVSDIKITTDGSITSVKAIQGSPTNYDINGSTLITISNLDSNNRLYFPNINVAENGIFIHNYGQDNYSSWVRKDNLLIESLSADNLFYKFGVSSDTYSCYLEFPENAAEIIKDGIYITYIRTSGEDGNISAKFLDSLQQPLTPVEDTTLTFSEANLLIYNTTAGTGGYNYETINDAYDNYKLTVGTFDTLITLRDYLNAVLSSELVSSGFVCDRTNDIQQTYKIMSTVNGIDTVITQIEPKVIEYEGLDAQVYELVQDIPANWSTTYENYFIKDGYGGMSKNYSSAWNEGAIYKYNGKDITLVNEPAIDAYSIKLYLMQYQNDFSTLANFEKSFYMLNNSESEVIKQYLEDKKSICHDFINIVPTDSEHSHFCFFENIFPLDMKITPQFELSDSQKTEVKNNIMTALYKNLNSSELKFGEEVLMDYLLDIIYECDGRIKNISIDPIEYSTNAVYALKNENDEDVSFYSIPINQLPSSQLDIVEIQAHTPGSVKLFITSMDEKYFPSVGYTYDSHILKLANKYKLLKEFTVAPVFIPNFYYKKLNNKDIFEPMEIEPANWGTTYTDYFYAIETSVVDDVDFGRFEAGNWSPVPVYNCGAFNPWDETIILDGGSFIYSEESTTPLDANMIYNAWTLDNIPIDLSDYGLNYMAGYNRASGNLADTFEIKPSIAVQFRDELYVKSALAGVTQFFVKDETFDYRINQDYLKTINSVKSVSTNLDIFLGTQNLDCGTMTSWSSGEVFEGGSFWEDYSDEFDGHAFSPWYSTENEYLLKDNEGLQLFAPNFIDDTIYSNFVKVEYRFISGVPANTDYQLIDNEYIIFYWRDDVDDSSLFSYIMYGKGNIIRPSYYMSANFDQSNEVGDQIYNMGWTSGKGTSSNPYLRSSATNGLLNYGLSAKINSLSSSQKTLSGTKTVTIRKINQVTLSADNYCYWILNSATSVNGQDRYRLFNEADTYRILQNGEYFIYSNKALAELVILSAGTKITRNRSGIAWDVNMIDISDIMSNGTSALVDNWYRLTSFDSVTVTQNQYITMGSGRTIRFDLIEPEFVYNLKIQSVSRIAESAVHIVDKLKFFAQLGTELSTATFTGQKTDSGVQWTIDSGVISLADYGLSISDTAVPDSGVCTVKLLVDKAWTMHIDSKNLKVYDSDRKLITNGIAHFVIRSKGVNDSVYENIDSLNIDNTSWDVNTTLKLNISNTESQNLLSNQSIVVNLMNGSKTTITGGNFVNTATPYFPATLMSADSINIDGGNTVYDCNNNSLYVYRELLSRNIIDVDTTLNTIDYKSNGETEIIYYPTNTVVSEIDCGKFNPWLPEVELNCGTFNPWDEGDLVNGGSPSSRSVSLTFQVPTGNYLLPIRSSSDKVFVSVTFNKQLVPLIYDDDQVIIKTTNTRFLDLYVNAKNKQELTITVYGNHTNNVTVTIGNIYKYSYPNELIPSNYTYETGINSSNYSPAQLAQLSESVANARFERYKKLIAKLDVDGRFNYTYEVPQDINISNPWLASSFFNANHIYNKYMICKYTSALSTQTSGADRIKILGR